jgi:hypothetical protein
MLNRNRFLTVIIALLFLPFIACNKNPCSGVTIVVTGTTVNSDGTNGRIDATATGSTGFTYNLNGGAFGSTGTFSGLPPGNYTVIAKNGDGCTGSAVFIVAASKTYLISQSTWKFSGATVGGLDASAFVQACQKDNILTFAAAGTGTLNEGATKCNAGDPQSTPFTWAFQGGETQLFISTTLFTGGNSTFTLVSLSATQLVLSQVITLGGTPQNAVVTFIH